MMMVMSTSKCVAVEQSYHLQNEKIMIKSHDDVKRRLKEQRAAYAALWADYSQVYDGRDMVNQYKRSISENEKARADIISQCLVYRPIKNSKGRSPTRYSSPPPDKAYMTEVQSAHDENEVPTKSIDGAKKLNVFERLPSDDTATTSATEESTISFAGENTDTSSARDLVRRKKSSPKHRCAERNLALKSVMKIPRYLPGGQLKCMFQLVKKEVDDRERLVRFRENVEVYCPVYRG
jgi:hypothetical protein